MSLLMISLLLVFVLAWAIYALTRHDAIEREVNTLVETSHVEHLYAEYKDNHNTLNLYFTAGFLLTLGYAITIWGGGFNFEEWTSSHYLFAAIGSIFVLSLTSLQRRLYRDIKQQSTSALLVTVLVVLFVIVSELTVTSERESNLVRERSQESPTYQALLGHVQSGLSPTLTDGSQRYVTLIAQEQQKLSACKTPECQSRHNESLAIYQANLAHAEKQYQQALVSQRADTLAYANKAKDFEYSEIEHSAVVRWIQQISNSSYEAAMLFIALIAVLAFEVGFHYIGTKEGIYVEAIARLGYSVRRKNVMPITFLPKTDETRIAEPYTSNSHAPDCMHVHEQPESETAPEISRKVVDMQVMYERAKVAKVNEVLHCPTCATAFTKSTYNQCFCNSKCRDEYHNTIKPERKIRG